MLSNLEFLLKCFICFERIDTPLLAPCCGKMGCKQCMTRWLSEKQECPHCRSHLEKEQLVQIRFLEDIQSALETKDVCADHDAPLYYYCQDCMSGLCPDCCVFDNRHSNHHLEHLHRVYERHLDRINKRMDDLRDCRQWFDACYERIQLDKQQLMNAQHQFLEQHQKQYESAITNIKRDTHNKMLTWQHLEDRLKGSLDDLQSQIDQLEHKLQNKSKIDTINNTDSLLELLHVDRPQMDLPKLSLDHFTDMVPNYESDTLLVHNFELHRHQKSILYSDPIHMSGLEWRLKVYCGGNGPDNEEFLSCYVELVKGQGKASYQYQVQLMHPDGTHFTREYCSVYTLGDCWGYNRFFRLEDLEESGYLQNNTIKIQYKVRALSWAQRSRDLSRSLD